MNRYGALAFINNIVTYNRFNVCVPSRRYNVHNIWFLVMTCLNSIHSLDFDIEFFCIFCHRSSACSAIHMRFINTLYFSHLVVVWCVCEYYNYTVCLCGIYEQHQKFNWSILIVDRRSRVYRHNLVYFLSASIQNSLTNKKTTFFDADKHPFVIGETF